jgi:hypothetical protein
VVYVDQSRPWLVEGFTRRTFTVMVEGVVERALAEGLVDEVAWRQGIRDLPDRGAGRDVLLHVLQGGRPEGMIGAAAP